GRAERIARIDSHLKQRQGKVDKNDAHQEARQQDAGGVLAPQAVAPHDPVRGPKRNQRERGAGDKLNLGLEEPDRSHVDEWTALSLYIGGAEDEVRPDIQQLSNTVIEQRRGDQVGMDDRVQISVYPPQLAK